MARGFLSQKGENKYIPNNQFLYIVQEPNNIAANKQNPVNRLIDPEKISLNIVNTSKKNST